MSFFDELLGIGGGAALVKEAYDKLGTTAEEAFGRFGTEGYEGDPGLATVLEEKLAFQPYTVTSATGGQFGMSTDPVTGQSSFSLSGSPEEQALQQMLLGDATSMFQKAVTPSEEREAQVLQRLRELRAPAEAQARADLEQRLAAQGRLGTRTAMFGGTPEQLAMEKAQLEAESADVIRAMEFAQAEQDRQMGLGQGLLEASYLPQGQLLAALQPGMTVAERQRQAASEQAQTYGEAYSAAINALLGGAAGQAELLGGLGTGIGSAAAKSLFSII